MKLFFSSALCILTTSLLAFSPSQCTWQGATVGCSSPRGIILDIPPNMTGESLLNLTRAYYALHLRPHGTSRIFTIAERRLFLYTLYAELCNASALWTGLICLYENDEKEQNYNCGVSVNNCYGYVVDREHFLSLERRYTMKNFMALDSYRMYVKGMRQVLFDDFNFEGEHGSTGARVRCPTDIDKKIFQSLLFTAALNNSEDFRYLEKNYNKDAVLWDHYWYIVRSNAFKQKWGELRRYYQEINKRLTEYETILDAQASMLHEDISLMQITQKLRNEWGEKIRDTRVRLHRCVYDAPYTLLITKSTHEVANSLGSTDSQSLLSTFDRWFARSDRDIQYSRNVFFNFQDKLLDAEDVMSNLTTTVAIQQTGRFITVLKMALGREAYAATVEQSKLLKQMEKVCK